MTAVCRVLNLWKIRAEPSAPESRLRPSQSKTVSTSKISRLSRLAAFLTCLRTCTPATVRHVRSPAVAVSRPGLPGTVQKYLQNVSCVSITHGQMCNKVQP